MSFDQQPLPAPIRGLRRAVYLTLGSGFLGLAVLGVFLPVLPTTPFLLLTSFFLIRSSPALNERVLRSRLLGPILRDWQQYHGVRRQVKQSAVGSVLLMVAATLFLGNLSWPLAALFIALGAIGLLVIWWLPSVDETPVEQSSLSATESVAIVECGAALQMAPSRPRESCHAQDRHHPATPTDCWIPARPDDSVRA